MTNINSDTGRYRLEVPQDPKEMGLHAKPVGARPRHPEDIDDRVEEMGLNVKPVGRRLARPAIPAFEL